MVDVIFAVNDPLKGHNILLYESTGTKDPSLTLKVPVKAQLTLSLMDKDATIHVADAVLPFPDLQKTAFSYLFTMNAETGQVTASISYLVPQTENVALYKKIPELKEKLNYLVVQLQGWNYKSDTILPKNLADLITGTLLFETDHSYKSGDISGLITSEKSTGAPDYLIKKINKNLEHLFFELYVGKPVIVIGKSKIAVEYAMATLDFLTPKKNLRKVIFTEDFIDPALYVDKIDVIGVSSIHEKRYKDYLIVDVDKFEIKGAKGKKQYIKFFIDDMIRIPASLAVQDIIKFTDQLDEMKKAFENVLNQPNVTEADVKKYLKTLSYDQANLLTDIEGSSKFTTSKGISGKLSSWVDELR